MGLTRAPDPHRNDAAPWRVEVEIDELVLHGFERVDRDAVADAFRRELDRLLKRDPGRLAARCESADDVGAHGRRVAADLARSMPSHRLGRSLALAVFRAIDSVPYAAGAPKATISRQDVLPATRAGAAPEARSSPAAPAASPRPARPPAAPGREGR